VNFEEPTKHIISFKKENCTHRVDTDAWVPLEHMLGMTKEKSYKYCLKYKTLCSKKQEGKDKCVNCEFQADDGFYCKLCTFILNRDLFEASNQRLSVYTFNRTNQSRIKLLYSTNLHVIDIDKTIEWIKTFNPRRKTTLVYNRFWLILPSPGYHLVYDYKELFDSYIRTYE
jgi:hypothetical protein